jgi:uncharacterized protein with von Willebrand factor type A (vWA) domain
MPVSRPAEARHADGAPLPGVDLAAFAVAFAARLQERGVPVDITRTGDFIRALTVSPPDSPRRLYWAARVCLVRRPSEIEILDAMFADASPDPQERSESAVTAGGGRDDALIPLPRVGANDRHDDGLPWATLPPAVAEADGSGDALALPERLPSDVAGLADVPFERLDAREMELLRTWLMAATASWPTRRSQRRRADHRGRRIALRATLARSRRTGWEPVELVRERAVDRPRRVVMLCDVSQSMQPQAPAYFQLMRALALATDAELFAFSTTLTRLTTVLRHRSAEVTVEQATARVSDRFGGTRIATNVRALLSSHHGERLRGAVVIIGSDGWDSDPPEELAAAMSRLRRRAYRVTWMNPRAAAPGFEPRVAAMAAALPYCDDLLPGDTFRSLRRVIATISRARSSGA